MTKATGSHKLRRRILFYIDIFEESDKKVLIRFKFNNYILIVTVILVKFSG